MQGHAAPIRSRFHWQFRGRRAALVCAERARVRRMFSNFWRKGTDKASTIRTLALPFASRAAGRFRDRVFAGCVRSGELRAGPSR